MTKILIISSNIHKELASQQLKGCLELIKPSNHDYQVEIAEAGTYEIPFIINAFQQYSTIDGYIALGLVLKKNKEHYDFIMSHINESFTHFALNNIIVGNGIVSGDSLEELTLKITSDDPCLSAYHSAFKAVDYMIRLKEKLHH